MTPVKDSKGSFALAGVLFAVFAYAWAAILIRWAEPAHPLAIAFWRVFIAAVVWTPFYWSGRKAGKGKTNRRFSMTGRQKLLTVSAGLFLSFHFATWISSLSYTTVSSAVFLILMQPLLIAVAAHLFINEKLNRWNLIAMGITLAGAVLICGGDFGISGTALFGDLLALLGAIGSTGYLFMARLARPDRPKTGDGIPLNRYLPLVYWTATVGLLLVILATGTSLGPYPLKTWASLLALGLIPTVIGHSLFNWALRYLPAFSVNIILVGEPVGASLLAFALLGESPSGGLLFGAPLMILAVVIVVLHPPGGGISPRGEVEAETILPSS